jgi:hypothetical protein
MRWTGMLVLTLLAPIPPHALRAQEAEIVVRGESARIEIERILEADNVDTSRLGSSEVVEAMERIERGRAPDDFWAAYRAHVLAWIRLAGLEAATRRRTESRPEDGQALIAAEEATGATFDEVERIARRHRARLPRPPWRTPT